MITQQRLKALVYYDNERGALIRRRDRSYKKEGSALGGHDMKGYLKTCIDGKYYKVHRLVWLYEKGEFPRGELDHINGVKDDNRLCNLRIANHSENSQNQRRAQKHNKVGLLGVVKIRDKYKAMIRIDGKQIKSCLFDDPIEAHNAYLKAKRIVHSHCTI